MAGGTHLAVAQTRISGVPLKRLDASLDSIYIMPPAKMTIQISQSRMYSLSPSIGEE